MFKELKGIDLKLPFPRMTYDEAMERFGSDKPDLRFGLELVTSPTLCATARPRFSPRAIQKGGVVKGIRIPNGGADVAQGSRRPDAVCRDLRRQGTGLDQDYRRRLAVADRQVPLRSRAEGKSRVSPSAGRRVVLFSADSAKIVHDSLGNLRLHLGEKLGLIPEKDYALVWVVDFPLMEFDAEEKRYVALHHPFTAPLDEDLHLLDSDPAKARSKAYDLALERHRGRRRQHPYPPGRAAKEDSRPHGHRCRGSAGQVRFPPRGVEFRRAAPRRHRLRHRPPGDAFERAKSLRDVIAFPKSQRAVCMLTDAPSEVAPRQLRELGIRVSGTDK